MSPQRPQDAFLHHYNPVPSADFASGIPARCSQVGTRRSLTALGYNPILTSTWSQDLEGGRVARHGKDMRFSTCEEHEG
jgi:hypothetical protein